MKKEVNNKDLNSREFDNDADELVHRHLEDQHHQITDEDLQNVKVGMTTSPDEPTKQAVRDSEDRIADTKADSEDDTIPGAQKTTPWDVINPGV